jgi:hypothetical protein
MVSRKRKRPAPVPATERRSQEVLHQQLRIPSLHTEDISLRVDSEIHQPQETPSSLAKTTPLSPRTDGAGQQRRRLPSQFHARTRNTRHNGDSEQEQRTQAHLENIDHNDPKPIHPSGNNLISLSNAREMNLSSWDEVREYSSQMDAVQIASTPVLPSDPMRLPLCRLGMQGEITQDDPGDTRRQTLPVAQRLATEADFHAEINGSQHQSHSQALHPTCKQHTQPACSDLGRFKSPEVASIHSPRSGALLSSSPFLKGGRPRFTLDSQVELERRGPVPERASPPNDSGRGSSLRLGSVDTAFDMGKYAEASGLSLSVDEHTTEQRSDRVISGSSSFLSASALSKYPGHLHMHTMAQPSKLLETRQGCFHLGRADAPRPGTEATRCQTQKTGNRVQTDRVICRNPAQHRNGPQLNSGCAKSPMFKERRDLALQNIRNATTPDAEMILPRDSQAAGPTMAESSIGAPTGVNVPIFVPISDGGSLTETDLLSFLSPMTGYLDERIVDLSMYNNAASTDRGRWIDSIQGTPTSRPGPIMLGQSVLETPIPRKHYLPNALQSIPKRFRPSQANEFVMARGRVDPRVISTCTNPTREDNFVSIPPLSPMPCLFGQPGRPFISANASNNPTDRYYTSPGLDLAMNRRTSPSSIFIPTSGCTIDFPEAMLPNTTPGPTGSGQRPFPPFSEASAGL